jgi:hypothetical protein
MLRRWVLHAAFVASFAMLAACHEQYSNDPKVAAAYAGAAAGIAVAAAVAAAQANNMVSNREVPNSNAGDLHALREYTVRAINRLRTARDALGVSSSPPLHEFAQWGSERLRADHESGKHLRGDERCSSRCGEIQGAAHGEPAALPEAQIDTALERMQNDPERSATLLAPDWRFVGVGIVQPGGEMYLTIDLSKTELE